MKARRTLLVSAVLVTGLLLAASPVSADTDALTHNSPGWVEQAILDAPGSAVDISGQRLLTSSDGTYAGYIYRFDGLGWVEEARLVASDAPAGWGYHKSVALHGSTAVVGAHLNDSEGDNAGAVYVFAFDGEAWTEQAKLVASDAYEGDQFGYSVDLLDERLVIGAWGNDAAYVFELMQGRWVEQAILSGDGGQFGEDVATQGDSVVVSGSTDGGVVAAFVFEQLRGQWRTTAVLRPPDPDRHLNFCAPVAMSGQKIVLGDCQFTKNNPGAAYVYTLRHGTWRLEATLVSHNPVPSGCDTFGIDVAIDGGTIAVAQPGDFCAAGVQVFGLDNGVWTFEETIEGIFPQAVALSGKTLAIGGFGDVGVFRR